MKQWVSTSPGRRRDSTSLRRGRRVIEMRHDRKAGFLGDLDRHVERCDAVCSAGDPADAHFHAHDQIAVLVDDAHALGRIEQPDIHALPDHHRLAEGKDAGEGDIQIGQDADGRRLDHVAAKSGKVAGTGASGIDQGGGAAAPGDGGSIDADRGTAPIDVGMKVDQPGRNEKTADVAGVARRVIDALADRDDFPFGKSNVASGVDPLRRIDEVTAAQNEIKHGPPFSVSPHYTLR